MKHIHFSVFSIVLLSMITSHHTSFHTLGYESNPTEQTSSCLIFGKGARCYSSSLRIFLSQDTPYFSPFGAAGTNSFSLEQAEPINSLDPIGHMWEGFNKKTETSDSRNLEIIEAQRLGYNQGFADATSNIKLSNDGQDPAIILSYIYNQGMKDQLEQTKLVETKNHELQTKNHELQQQATEAKKAKQTLEKKVPRLENNVKKLEKNLWKILPSSNPHQRKKGSKKSEQPNPRSDPLDQLLQEKKQYREQGKQEGYAKGLSDAFLASGTLFLSIAISMGNYPIAAIGWGHIGAGAYMRGYSLKTIAIGIVGTGLSLGINALF